MTAKLLILFKERSAEALSMELQMIRDRIEQIKGKRDALVRLLEQPDLGTLRIDVNQALEEMDDLLEEFERAFPNS